MPILKTFMIIISIGFILGALGSLFLNLEAPNREALVDTIGDDPLTSSLDIAMVGIGYDISTPAIRPCRLLNNDSNQSNIDGACFGDPEKVTWMIEDIPFPDSKDFLFIVPYLLLCVFITKIIWRTQLNIMAKILIIFLLFTVGTIVFWIILKSVFYYIMLEGAEGLGIKEEVVATRENVTAATHQAGAVGPLLMLAAFTSFMMCYALIKGKKKQ